MSMPRPRLMPRFEVATRNKRSRGQGLVEFAMLVPVFLLILLGMLEFGFAFNHNMTLEYATREGARAGAAAADGTMRDSSCVDPVTNTARAFGSSDVDPLIIAAVDRVLRSPGSLVDMASIANITIYQAKPDGTPVAGKSNVWPIAIGAGANVPCTGTPAQKMDFSAPSAPGWTASSRNNHATPSVGPDFLGVSITYTYKFRSALGGILKFIGGSGAASLQMSDKTVMALQPTN